MFSRFGFVRNKMGSLEVLLLHWVFFGVFAFWLLTRRTSLLL